MIVDLLMNVEGYGALLPGLTAGLDFLRTRRFESVEPGRVEIDGDRLFAIVQEYETKAPGSGKWEAHRRYWDIQYVVQGTEVMHWADIAHLEAGAYVPEKDFLPLEGTGDLITLRTGMVAILSPQDAHMPGMAIERPERVRKVVVKVAV